MHKLIRIFKNRRSLVALIVTLLLFAVSCVLLIYLLQGIDWKVVRQGGLKALVPILALTVLQTLAYTLLIYLLVRGSGYPTTLWKAYLVLSASLTANYVTPLKMGIPLRVYLYNELMSVPAAIGAALVAVEAVIGMLVPAALAIVGIVALFPDWGLAAPIVLVVLLLAALLCVLYAPVGRFRHTLERLPFPRLTTRLIRLAERFQSALRRMSPAVIGSVVVLDLLMLAIQALRIWLVLGVFGPAPSFLALLAVFTMSITFGNLSMIPMGLGVRDASFTVLLVQLGIPQEIALSATVVQRLFSPGWPLLLGLISSNVLGIQVLLSPQGETTENGKS